MKKAVALIILAGSLFAACKSSKPSPSENAEDAARNFIRAALDGKFEEARNYMLRDSVNDNYMDVAERGFEHLDNNTRNGYRGASIHIHNVDSLDGQHYVVIYSNSFVNDHDTLKVIDQDGHWLVDFKYLYLHDSGNGGSPIVTTDTIP